MRGSETVNWWDTTHYWADDGTPIGHWVVGDLCRDVLELLQRDEVEALAELGAAVERCLTSDNDWGPEYAETGLLETLGSLVSWLPEQERAAPIERFREVLGPVGRDRWAIQVSDIRR